MSDGITDSQNGLTAYLFGVHGKLPEPKIGDSSDKTYQIVAAPRENIFNIMQRVDKGYAITPQEAKLLADMLRKYYP